MTRFSTTHPSIFFAERAWPVNLSMETINPCLTCGACCAFYRASFYWAETEAGTPGGVPDHLTEKINDFRVQMKGTRGPNPRCIALTGLIGQSVYCTIYEQRASVCRVFQPSLLDGVLNERCDRARQSHSLKPLTLCDWGFPEDLPQAA